jgi:hypothetical protein
MLRTHRLRVGQTAKGISLGVFRTFGDTALVEEIEMAFLPYPSKNWRGSMFGSLGVLS